MTKRYIREARPRFEHLLAELVELPSVSMDPAHAADVRKTATVAAQVLASFGAEARLIETEGYPVVWGGWTVDRRAPIVTIYNHLDVQPAQEPEWTRRPFAFQKQDGLYRGRGATDDKGPALTALLAAKYAVEQGLPLNIHVLWELEEEIGSPHFAQALQPRHRIPAPDSVLVSDTIWIARNKPAMAYGLRGLLAVKMTLRTGRVDAHSGLTGGAARNPLAELAAVAAACVDAKTGRVTIPGFYDDVVPPTKGEIADFLASGFEVARFKKAYGLESLRATQPAEILRRIWATPTFEVHGLAGGYQGPGVKTVVPAYGELKVSMRLVSHQKPERIFARLKRFVAGVNPDVKVEAQGMLQPYLGPRTGPYAEAAKRAMVAGFGKAPAMIREGGSIGAVVTMQRAWRAPILFMGLSLPEHGYHAPNEYFDWGQASGGMKALSAYFAELAAMKRRA